MTTSEQPAALGAGEPLEALATQRLTCAARIVAYIAVALWISIPCFWPKHIQANDLSSHMYNAWLVNQDEAGELTNVLFDHLPSWLLHTGSVVLTERVAVVTAGQIFFWVCFLFVSVLGRRPAWTLTALLAMLAYGSIFRLGFFNLALKGDRFSFATNDIQLYQVSTAGHSR